MSILKPELLSPSSVTDAAALGATPAEAQETALIQRLANELFGSGSAALAGGAGSPQAAGLHAPLGVDTAPSGAAPVDAVPVAAAGVTSPATVGVTPPASAGALPAAWPSAVAPRHASAALPGTAGSVPAPATDNNNVALAGGFPATTSSTGVPPVHPSVVDAEPEATPVADAQLRRAGESVPSGTQRLYQRDGHEFGEPYFYTEKQTDTRTQKGEGNRTANTVQSRTANVAQSSSASGSRPTDFGSTSDGLGGLSALADTPAYYFLPNTQPAKNGGKHTPQGVRDSGLPWGGAFGHAPSTGFDIQAIRRDFPALHQQVNGNPLIWLDNAATTHKPQAVIDATSLFYGRDNSNIHRAAHALAARSTDLFEGGRENVRRFLGAGDTKEIVFVRGTTEAINLVAQSYGHSHIGEGDEILLTELEHHANIVPWQILAGQVGAVLKVIPINDRGELIVEKIPELITSRTKIVSVAHVSNSLGTVNPVQEIIALAHSRGVPVLVDGAQSTPHIPINVQALDADFYVFSGHKIFGPTGIGALYAKRHWLETLPAWQGGGHMIKDVTFGKTVFNGAPEKFEAGTPDIAGVVGLGAAIDYLFSVGIPAIAAYEHSLLEYATERLATVSGLRPIGTAANKASVLSFVLSGFDNLAVARYLDEQGIAVRAGHHCAQPAIRHFGLESSVRPSLAFYNTFAEVDALVAALHRLTRH